MSVAQYPDIFNELKAQVRDAGLLKRVPIRGSVEMVGTIISMIVVYLIVFNWQTLSPTMYVAVLLGLFMSVIFTRAVFISHDILHTQYFKNKSLSFKLSYPFAAFILSNSSSWWDFKHNINHHTWCNIPQKDEDILAMDGAFTSNHKGNKTWP
jgi:fatty acid desaturase